MRATTSRCDPSRLRRPHRGLRRLPVPQAHRRAMEGAALAARLHRPAPRRHRTRPRLDVAQENGKQPGHALHFRLPGAAVLLDAQYLYPARLDFRERKIRGRHGAEKCTGAERCPRPSGKPAQYVIEVNAGLADKYDIAPGSKVAWSDFVTGLPGGDFPVDAFQ